MYNQQVTAFAGQYFIVQNTGEWQPHEFLVLRSNKLGRLRQDVPTERMFSLIEQATFHNEYLVFATCVSWPLVIGATTPLGATQVHHVLEVLRAPQYG